MPNSSAPSIAAITTSRPVLSTAIRPQLHPVPQPVQHQHLMRLRQPHLPRQPGILDRGLRRRTRAAHMPADQDRVRLRLCHPGRDRPDPAARHQLHANRRLRIDLLEVVDELRQILDRVDVVVRRRADQRHARRRVPQLGDQPRYLEARQLPALAGLGTLRDLDLDLAAGVQILRRHPEPPRRDLLDRRVRVVAIRPRRRPRPGPRRPRRCCCATRCGSSRSTASHAPPGSAPRARSPAPAALADLRDALDLVHRHIGVSRPCLKSSRSRSATGFCRRTPSA